MERIIITIILVNIEMTIVQTIIFELEKHFVTENLKKVIKKIAQNGQIEKV